MDIFNPDGQGVVGIAALLDFVFLAEELLAQPDEHGDIAVHGQFALLSAQVEFCPVLSLFNGVDKTPLQGFFGASQFGGYLGIRAAGRRQFLHLIGIDALLRAGHGSTSQVQDIMKRLLGPPTMSVFVASHQMRMPGPSGMGGLEQFVGDFLGHLLVFRGF